MKQLRALYLNNRLFTASSAVVVFFILSFVLNLWIVIPQILFFLLVAACAADYILLFRIRVGLRGHRIMAEKLSNGDDNAIKIHLESYYPFKVTLNILDEIPHQFQRRELDFLLTLASGEKKTIQYWLRPVKRGTYSFGSINVFAQTPIGFLSRRFRFAGDTDVPVYPSYVQMRKYELLALSNNLTDSGIKRIRRIGQNREFELIKEYVPGDDFRTINWKATARRNHLMVNHYQDERSQQVYCLIDKGRVMQMPFNGLSLLDYAINASLVISNIAIKKSDKAGLLTFQDKVGSMVVAGRRNNQMAQILEALYNQKTAYRETDFSSLYNRVRRKINQRSLLLIFTNFESIFGLRRQLPYIKMLSLQHLVVVIFFENTEMKSLLESPASTLKEVYQKAIAEKFSFEKRQIVKELAMHGIQSLLTAPDQLTVNTINKYLELKSRGMI